MIEQAARCVEIATVLEGFGQYKRSRITLEGTNLLRLSFMVAIDHDYAVGEYYAIAVEPLYQMGDAMKSMLDAARSS